MSTAVTLPLPELMLIAMKNSPYGARVSSDHLVIGGILLEGRAIALKQTKSRSLVVLFRFNRVAFLVVAVTTLAAVATVAIQAKARRTTRAIMTRNVWKRRRGYEDAPDISRHIIKTDANFCSFLHETLATLAGCTHTFHRFPVVPNHFSPTALCSANVLVTNN